jgi:hypothetical protein
MRTFCIPILLAGLSLVSCTRRDTAVRREEPAAREAGREAYQATQDLKRGAKKAARELRDAGKEMHQGWNEAKRSDQRKKE